MANYDVVGNIVIIKFPRAFPLKNKKKFAEKFLREHKNVRTVLEKIEKFSGRLRKQTTKFIAGEKTKESLYRENDCVFRFNVDSCYFSPRLSSERKELASKVKKGEKVLVMFGGVAPFAIVVGKMSKAEKIFSVELNRECNKYAKENVKRNKLDNIEIIQGDARKVVLKLKEKFDRILMPRPQLKDSFLDVAFRAAKKGATIYYYDFFPENEKSKLLDLIKAEARKAKRKIKILKIKKAGEIGKRRFRWRVDFKVD